MQRRSGVQEPSVHSQQQIAQDAFVHWHKSHPTFHENIGILQTEETEEHFVSEKRYKNICCSCLWSPYAQVYYRVKRIREFRHYVQAIFEDAFKTIRWLDLPGGQHQMAIDRNYMMNYIWLMSFITSEIDTANKDSARHIRYRFEDILFHAESLGIVLQQFFKPLRDLAQSHCLVEEMGDLIETKVVRLAVERKILTLALKPDYTILPGNHIEDFSKLLSYIRRDSQTWSRFRSLPDADKVDVVSKGLMEISDNLKELKGILKRPLKALQEASCDLIFYAMFRPTLVSHVRHMRNAVKKIAACESEAESEENQTTEALLAEISSHYAYVMRFGEMLVEEVWDIILMVRLSYNFIKESPQNNIMVASHEAVMVSKFKPKMLKKLLRPSAFTVDDFYLVECPDTLRKLPIVILSTKTELCLHLQGHRNSHKSKVSNTIKRFTLKRINSGSERTDTENPTTQERGTLLFVSEGD